MSALSQETTVLLPNFVQIFARYRNLPFSVTVDSLQVVLMGDTKLQNIHPEINPQLLR